MVELLVLPALIGYGEAAMAYAGDAWQPGRAGRLATWGVRLGWLAQTALIVASSPSSDGFPWDTWAGTLNLFVWLVVGVYLVWGCRARYRLLGLTIMPLACRTAARVLACRCRRVARRGCLTRRRSSSSMWASCSRPSRALPWPPRCRPLSLRRAQAQAAAHRLRSSDACRRSSPWTRSRRVRCSWRCPRSRRESVSVSFGYARAAAASTRSWALRC